MKKLLVPILLATSGAVIGLGMGEANHSDNVKEARADLVSLGECKEGLQATERRSDGFLYCAGVRLYEPVGIVQEDDKLVINWEKTEEEVREPIDGLSSHVGNDVVLGLGGMGVGAIFGTIILLSTLTREQRREDEEQQPAVSVV